jgi:hypothetical protein
MFSCLLLVYGLLPPSEKSIAVNNNNNNNNINKIIKVFLIFYPHLPSFSFQAVNILCAGRDSSVGTATRYGLDGPGIESRWGETFGILPDRP